MEMMTNLIFAKQRILLSRNAAGFSLPESRLLLGLSYQTSAIAVAGVTLLAELILPAESAAELEVDNDGLELVNLRQALEFFSQQQAEQIIYAQQIIHYQNTHKFCGRCASVTVVNLATQRLACPLCQDDIYPQIAPAMIVAVTHGEKLLMAQANHFAPQMWSLLAGFCEVGESVEQTVEREVFEEVGLRVKNIRYWGSQYWPFPNSLMLAFTAEYASGEIVLDRNEMRAAGFYGRDELPGRPSSNLSIASRLIDELFSS